MNDESLKKHVSLACRVLFANGQDHFFLGHVSARENEGSDFWVKPSGLGLGETMPSDVVHCGLDGMQIGGGRPLHREMPIHTEIYRNRRDVNCVIHTHPFHAAAFAAADSPLKMVSQDSVLFADGIGTYPSPELVVTPPQGQALAETLGNHNAVILRNHGLVVADETVPGAVFLAMSLERSLRLQLAASQYGAVVEIAADEATAMNRYFTESYSGRIASTWDYLLRQAGLS